MGDAQASLHNGHALGRQGRLSSSTGGRAAAQGTSGTGPKPPNWQDARVGFELKVFLALVFVHSTSLSWGPMRCQALFRALEIQQLWDRVSLCSAYVLGGQTYPRLILN